MLERADGVAWIRKAQRAPTAVLAGLLALLALAFHASALTLSFSFDDGGHLANATRLSPLGYFLDPVTSVWVSGSNVAPWNLFVYQVNVFLFGLSPAWHHAHLMALVAGTVVATFIFLRLWLPARYAALGAALFAVGAPGLFISHQEMAGHYGYGLLFSVVALHSTVLYLRGGKRGYLAVSAAAYLLAMACKEIFVPLPLVLAALPAGTWRSRLVAVWPHALLLAGYTAWRWVGFDGSFVGARAPGEFVIPGVLGDLGRIPGFLFGRWWGLPVALLAAAAVWTRPRNALAPTAAALAALALPLLPLMSSPSVARIEGPDRYLYALWWGVCCWLATAAASLDARGRHRMAWGVLLVMLILQVWTSHGSRDAIRVATQRWAEWHRAVLDPGVHGHLLIPDDKGYFSLKSNVDGMRVAARRLGLPYSPDLEVIGTQEAFHRSSTGHPGDYLIFDEQSRRLRQVADAAELAQLSARLKSRPLPPVYVASRLPRLGFPRFGSATLERIGSDAVFRGVVPIVRTGQSFVIAASSACAVTSVRLGVPTRGLEPTAPFEVALRCEPNPGTPRALCLIAELGGEYGVVPVAGDPACARLMQR